MLYLRSELHTAMHWACRAHTAQCETECSKAEDHSCLLLMTACAGTAVYPLHASDEERGMATDGLE